MKEIMKKRIDAPMLIIDIAVPRDVDARVGEIPGITLFNIDDLRKIVDKNLDARRKMADSVEEMADKEMERFHKHLAVGQIKPVIVSFRKYVEEECSRELQKIHRVFGDNLSPEQKEALEHFARSVANKIAHQPLSRIKDMASNGKGGQYADVLKELFSLQRPEDDPEKEA
jgi:glutamyl-tRNA reductase